MFDRNTQNNTFENEKRALLLLLLFLLCFSVLRCACEDVEDSVQECALAALRSMAAHHSLCKVNNHNRFVQICHFISYISEY